MLIQITNRCFEGCKHCMQNSNPRGKHMKEETFDKVLRFCKDAKPMVVSVTGGEPTEHPMWNRMTRQLLAIPSVRVATIVTNGTWLDDDKTRIDMARLIRDTKGRVKVQVYSNPKYYPDYEWAVENEARFRSIGCITDFTSPIFMQDLGRARKNCKQEVSESDHVPSCINSHLIALQARSLPHFCSMAAQAGKFCRPLIDPHGCIHMSESWLCQTVAHVDDGVEEAFRKMRQARPCKDCQLYRNFEQLHPKEMELLNQ